jgi:hypothetical protein
MNRRLIRSFLLLLTCACVSFAASALAEQTADGINYEISEGTATVVSYIGAGVDVVIPPSLGSAPVTAIADCAFKNNDNIETVSMPDTLQTIGSEAFRDCDNLKSADIPSSVTSIGVRAFFYCKSLMKAEVPAGVETLEERVFYYCTSMTEVTLHEGLKVIKTGALQSCSSLSSIDIPSTVQEMYAYASRWP